MHVTKTITVLREPQEVFEFWRDFTNLPRFMHHLESVDPIGPGRTHWKARAPVGRLVEWDAEIVEERPGEFLAWRSLDGDVPNEGEVTFTPAPGERGTEIRVDLDYDAPGGKLGATLAKLFGEEPSLQVADDLRRLKQVLETGDVVRSTGSPEGVGQGVLQQEAAQPAHDTHTARETAP